MIKNIWSCDKVIVNENGECEIIDSLKKCYLDKNVIVLYSGFYVIEVDKKINKKEYPFIKVLKEIEKNKYLIHISKDIFYVVIQKNNKCIFES